MGKQTVCYVVSKGAIVTKTINDNYNRNPDAAIISIEELNYDCIKEIIDIEILTLRVTVTFDYNSSSSAPECYSYYINENY